MNLTKNREEIAICESLKAPVAKIVEATAESIKSMPGKKVLRGSLRDFFIEKA